jgi:hypothetical protein
MGKPLGRQDEEFLRSAWDWAGEAAAVSGAAVRVCLMPTNRRGVWTLRAEAVEVVGGRAVSICYQHVQEWPSAAHGTLAGALYAALLQLDKRLPEKPDSVAPGA